MQISDLEGIRLVAQDVHPGLPESDFVCTERVELFPEGCWTLVVDDSATAAQQKPKNHVLGYAISHPILRGQPPALDSQLHAIPTAADIYYIHDIAIMPEARGGGLAAECLQKLLKGPASRWEVTCLISVYGTSNFWAKFGFQVPEAVSEQLREKLGGYGEDAVYLERQNRRSSSDIAAGGESAHG